AEPPPVNFEAVDLEGNFVRAAGSYGSRFEVSNGKCRRMLRATLTPRHWSNGLARSGAAALPSRAFAPEIRAARVALRNQEAAGAVGSRAFARSGGRRETFSSKVRHFSGTERVLWAPFRRISGSNGCRPGGAL